MESKSKSEDMHEGQVVFKNDQNLDFLKSDDVLDLPNQEFKKPRIMEGLPEVEVEEVPRTEVVTAAALSNGVILKTILKELSVRDLLKARLVNQNWKGVANTVLKTRHEPPFIVVNKKTDFDELFYTIWKCGEEQFPFTGLKIHLNSSDFGRKPEKWSHLLLLRVFGHLFTNRHLRIDWSSLTLNDDGWEEAGTLAKVLTGPMSGFEEIKIRRGKGAFGNVQLTLGSTKVLEFDSACTPDDVDEEWLTALLQACPNLQEIRGIRFASMPGVIAAGKCELVVDMNYCECYNVHALNHNREGLRLRKLRSLRVLCPTGHCNALSFGPIRDILEASAETLNYLDMGHTLEGSRTGTWPQLRNLRELLVTDDAKCFPTQVLNIFTSLSCVTLQHMYVYDHAFPDYLWNDAVPTVNTLKIRCQLNSERIAFLATIFPNVSCVSVDCSYLDMDDPDLTFQFQHSMWDIWNLKEFGNLSELEILDVPVKRMAEAHFSLDAFVTGYPQFVVNKLRAQPILFTGPYTDLMREATENVASLKGLKVLSMSFIEFTSLTPQDFSDQKPFVSNFLFQAGLSALPGLETRFSYNFSLPNSQAMEKLLRPVSHVIPIKCQP